QKANLSIAQWYDRACDVYLTVVSPLLEGACQSKQGLARTCVALYTYEANVRVCQRMQGKSLLRIPGLDPEHRVGGYRFQCVGALVIKGKCLFAVVFQDVKLIGAGMVQ